MYHIGIVVVLRVFVTITRMIQAVGCVLLGVEEKMGTTSERVCLVGYNRADSSVFFVLISITPIDSLDWATLRIPMNQPMYVSRHVWSITCAYMDVLCLTRYSIHTIYLCMHLHSCLQVDALRGVGVHQIAAGSGHTVVLTTDGEVYTCTYITCACLCACPRYRVRYAHSHLNRGQRRRRTSRSW
jgi:hypothetical protein